MIKHLKTKHLTYCLTIAIVAFVLILPQLISGNMVLGSDVIFHFNRFYNTAEQVRHLNFDYFISLYGFQQSGRIVNALYGPVLSYCQGVLVLVSRNWFTYQLLSNWILYCLAGLSMYIFLIKAKLKKPYALIGSLVYLSTYSIQYWIIRQGFTSWGAAFLPLALSILFQLTETKQVPKWLLGIYTAMMVQTHMLTSLILVLIYLPFFGYAFFQNRQKGKFIRDLVVEILIFICLTLNVWLAYVTVFARNQMARPFINHEMSYSTINQHSFYWLLNPAILAPILVVIYLVFVWKWWSMTASNRLWLGVMTFMLLLSTSLVPWDWLIKQNNSVAELVQFPFRFFVPVSVIAIYLILKICSRVQGLQPYLKIFLSLGLVISLVQSLFLLVSATAHWNTETNFMPSQYKVVFNADIASVKQSFYDRDKKKALDLVAKGTPDYLPIYPKRLGDKQNRYDLYLSKIVAANKKFTKTVTHGGLQVEWQGTSSTEMEVPVVVYKDTVVILNGKEIAHRQLNLSSVGTPSVKQKNHQTNTLFIYYRTGLLEKAMLAGTVLSWLVVLYHLAYRLGRKQLVTQIFKK